VFSGQSVFALGGEIEVEESGSVGGVGGFVDGARGQGLANGNGNAGTSDRGAVFVDDSAAYDNWSGRTSHCCQGKQEKGYIHVLETEPITALKHVNPA
jgi:hypothetical protein